MKTIVLLFIFSLGLFLPGYSQSRVDVTFLKTTSLVFQYNIINVDRGSDDVLAQRVKGADNTLQLKAARKNFPQTNVTVITSDGQLHHFDVSYSDNPVSQTFQIKNGQPGIALADGINMEVLRDNIQRILRKNISSSIKKVSRNKMRFSLSGIYIDGSQVYYDLVIRNTSNIRFDIQSLRFFIRDAKRAKRTALQETEVQPVFVSDKNTHVDGSASMRIVLVLPKFTITDAKRLNIELFEKNGGRHMKLNLKDRHIINAERLSK